MKSLLTLAAQTGHTLDAWDAHWSAATPPTVVYDGCGSKRIPILDGDLFLGSAEPAESVEMLEWLADQSPDFELFIVRDRVVNSRPLLRLGPRNGV